MEPAFNPPTAIQVVRRALTLSALTCRGHLEHNLDDASTRSLHARILQWLASCQLLESLEDAERATLLAPKGALEEPVRQEAVRGIEGAAVLAWALGKYPLPPVDVPVEPFKVGDALGFLWEGATNLIRYPKLRGRGELEAYHGLARAVDQRLHEAELRPERPDFAATIPAAWLRALGLYRTPPLVDGDLALGGQPLHQVDPQLRRSIAQLATERLRAASWLAGERERY
jgi:hypothetical protein